VTISASSANISKSARQALRTASLSGGVAGSIWQNHLNRACSSSSLTLTMSAAQRFGHAGAVGLAVAQVEVEKARRLRGRQQLVQRLARALAALRQGAEADRRRRHPGKRIERGDRVDEVVGLPGQDHKAVPARAALDHHAAGLFHAVDLQAAVGHRETLELAAHDFAVAVAADARDHQLRGHEGGQVARHVERRAAGLLLGDEVVYQRLAEQDRRRPLVHGRADHCGTVSLNDARSDSLSNRRARLA
jgi:hypothetical protein